MYNPILLTNHNHDYFYPICLIASSKACINSDVAQLSQISSCRSNSTSIKSPVFLNRSTVTKYNENVNKKTTLY